MEYRLNPVTPNTWMLWYMSQWDMFIVKEDFNGIQFKAANINSYKCFREAYQILDAMNLDFMTLKFNV